MKLARYIGIPLSILTIISFILYFGPIKVLHSISLLPPYYFLIFIIALIFHIFSQIFWGFRIYFLTYGRGKPIKLTDAIKVVISSLFASTITPGYVGGEPIRIKKLMDYGLNPGESTAITVGERGFDSIFFGIFFLLLVLDGFIYSSYRIYLFAGGILLLVFLIIIVLSISGKTHLGRLVKGIFSIYSRISGKNHNTERIEKEVESYSNVMKDMFSGNIVVFILGLSSTFLLWISDFFVPIVLILGFGIHVNFITVILIEVILVLISLAPITPGAAGIMEILMIASFTSIVGTQFILIFVIMWRFITFYFNIIFGSFYLHWILKESPKK